MNGLHLPLLAALSWTALWYTPDQAGQRLYVNEQYAQAAQTFEDPMRIGDAWFRAGEFEKAEQAYARSAAAEALYNRANCLVMRGKYEDAVEIYDLALGKKPDFPAAQTNREIAVLRAAKTKQEGGDMGDQKLGADKVVFDKNKKAGGQDTETSTQQMISNEQFQSLWLRNVQTRPADFLKAKFSWQAANPNSGEEAP